MKTKFATKVYSGGASLGWVGADDLSTLKRKASRVCNACVNPIDTMVLYRIDGVEGKEVRYTRMNKISPDNTLVRGQWF